MLELLLPRNGEVMPRSDNRRKKETLRGRKRRALRPVAPLADPEQPRLHQGMFMAPCGLTVMYMTPAELPLMEAYRHAAIADHVTGGECPSPEVYVSALET